MKAEAGNLGEEILEYGFGHQRWQAVPRVCVCASWRLAHQETPLTPDILRKSGFLHCWENWTLGLTSNRNGTDDSEVNHIDSAFLGCVFWVMEHWKS